VGNVQCTMRSMGDTSFCIIFLAPKKTNIQVTSKHIRASMCALEMCSLTILVEAGLWERKFYTGVEK
jgi:hypothetical protein